MLSGHGQRWRKTVLSAKLFANPELTLPPVGEISQMGELIWLDSDNPEGAHCDLKIIENEKNVVVLAKIDEKHYVEVEAQKAVRAVRVCEEAGSHIACCSRAGSSAMCSGKVTGGLDDLANLLDCISKAESCELNIEYQGNGQRFRNNDDIVKVSLIKAGKIISEISLSITRRSECLDNKDRHCCEPPSSTNAKVLKLNGPKALPSKKSGFIEPGPGLF